MKKIKQYVKKYYCVKCKHLVKFESKFSDCDALAIGEKQCGCVLGEFIFFKKR
ncbi:hypothetical protein [Clostridium perfringens]|uniref:Uncharacterized protein n=1 Tax=Clostridium perfringens TaxID=1502 RepID=A0AAW9K5Q4_CLOPF|nr:hypothetical protein [Clostridium perfringens]